ncbi:MAG: 2-oxo-3-hexenedioate decarboxylase [Gammaproteobacteria bacterium]|jgi:2-oxo-3-hexenedioate decarboxylase|nr:2-oxo-3-hexenedioate decarboxylase [Gammaproteobacteria bacterium]
MPLTAAKIASYAEQLDTAALECQAVPQLESGLTLAEAYEIQWTLRKRRIAAGARVSGLKMGLTSRAKMKQMGVATPIYGFLLDEYLVPADEVVTSKLIHPRIEPEIAFVTRTCLQGPGCTSASALAAVDFVIPAIEVIDSRYADFKFDLPSVVADNASSARYIVGSCARRVDELDLRTLGVVVEKNGEGVAFGAGAAVLGSPALSLAMLANLLAEREQSIPAGTYVMTGGITEAIAAKAGDHFAARFQALGSVSVRFT